MDEERIDFFNTSVLIDSFCYIHILFRHYSSSIKQHQLDKTYHYDENIDYKKIPLFLKDVVIKFKDNCAQDDFDRNKIYLSFGDKTYAIWFRPIQISKPGNLKESILRLQTFYPITNTTENATIGEFRKVNIDSSLIYFVRKPNIL